MSILGRAIREVRAPLSYQQIWGAGGNWRPQTDAGVAVDSQSALGLIAVWACVRLLSDAVSTLPVRQVVTVGDASFSPSDQPPWLTAPRALDPSVTIVDHFTQVMLSLLLAGNSYTAAMPDTASPMELAVLDPRRVRPRAAGGRTLFDVRKDDGSLVTYDATTIVHIPLMRQPGTLEGLSPIDAAKQGIGLGLAADQYGSRFFGAGATLSGVVQAKGPLTQPTADALKEKFKSKYGGVSNAFDVAVLDNGAEWKPLSVTPEQGQFLATRKFQVEEIARLFAVPPSMIGMTEPGAVSYASSEMQMLSFLQHALRPYLVRIEAAYSRLVSVPARISSPGARAKVEFSVDGLLRADFKTRMEGYTSAIGSGVMLRSEARRLENLPPVGGLDQPLVNLGMAPDADASQRVKVASARLLVDAGFDPEESLAAVGMAPIAHLGIPPKTLQDVSHVDPADPSSLYPPQP